MIRMNVGRMRLFGMQKFFQNEGLNLSLDGFVGNTFNSHRLVAYAEQQSLEKADEVMGRLLEATHAQACANPSLV